MLRRVRFKIQKKGLPVHQFGQLVVLCRIWYFHSQIGLIKDSINQIWKFSLFCELKARMHHLWDASLFWNLKHGLKSMAIYCSTLDGLDISYYICQKSGPLYYYSKTLLPNKAFKKVEPKNYKKFTLFILHTYACSLCSKIFF